MLVPGWNEWMLASARRRASCTRSSARSTLPHNEIANARNPGTEPRISWRTESSMGILCPLIVEAVEQIGEPVRYTLAHDLVVNCAQLLAQFGPGRPVQPVRLRRLCFASGFRGL